MGGTRTRLFLLLVALTSLCIVQLTTADHHHHRHGYWNILKLNQKIKPVGEEEENSWGDSLKSYCESWRMNVEINNIRGFDVVPQECVSYIKKYMTSSQYSADSRRALEEATVYLSSCCSLQGDGKDAWIFDLDDTLLSTIPYFKKHSFGGEKVNATCLEDWMREGKAPALPHSLQFYHLIKDKGVKIFLVSSRREILRSPTVDNLIDVGYHGWTNLILRGFEDEYMKVEDYKAEVRRKLVGQGYRIWGIIGDQWSSLNGLPSAKRTFKLPNSMYYVP
ncbi:acid phosphatase 1-like [Carica papaya]|uniref:acid phosphatase 1-like n=1 Tax=Carica papaya TaxID=3649 RepID=UPI000B8CA6E1|nr:acid phosphatase 1-like [Carica papaya]